MIDSIYYGVGATDFWTCKTSTRSGYTTLTKEVYVSNIENDVYKGGSKRESYEVILKPNTNYLLRLTNLTNSVNNVSFEVSYYI